MLRFFFPNGFVSLGLWFSVFFLTACSVSTPTPQTNAYGGLTTFTTTEDTETSLVKAPNNLHQFCASRESDAVSAPQTGLSFGLGVGGVSKESVGATSGTGALSLGGRDPLVLITRELMYRVCEISLNHNLNKEETIALYKYFIDKIITIAPLTKSDGTASQGIAPPGYSKDSSTYDSKYKDDTSDDYYNKGKSSFQGF